MFEVSVGVLNAGDIRFDPPLPIPMQDALNSMSPSCNCVIARSISNQRHLYTIDCHDGNWRFRSETFWVGHVCCFDLLFWPCKGRCAIIPRPLSSWSLPCGHLGIFKTNLLKSLLRIWRLQKPAQPALKVLPSQDAISLQVTLSPARKFFALHDRS